MPPLYDVRAEQRLAVEQDLPVRQPLQSVGIAHLGDREIAEGASGLRGQRAQPVLQLRGDVEDVLVVRLLELEPHPRREADGVGRAMEDLHRVGVESALRGRVRDPHEVLLLGHGLSWFLACRAAIRLADPLRQSRDGPVVLTSRIGLRDALQFRVDIRPPGLVVERRTP